MGSGSTDGRIEELEVDRSRQEADPLGRHARALKRVNVVLAGQPYLVDGKQPRSPVVRNAVRLEHRAHDVGPALGGGVRRPALAACAGRTRSSPSGSSRSSARSTTSRAGPLTPPLYLLSCALRAQSPNIQIARARAGSYAPRRSSPTGREVAPARRQERSVACRRLAGRRQGTPSGPLIGQERRRVFSDRRYGPYRSDGLGPELVAGRSETARPMRRRGRAR